MTLCNKRNIVRIVIFNKNIFEIVILNNDAIIMHSLREKCMFSITIRSCMSEYSPIKKCVYVRPIVVNLSANIKQNLKILF